MPISMNGVCHGDELMYLFDIEFPLLFCNIHNLIEDASTDCLSLVDINVPDSLTIALSCLVNGTFHTKWGDCLTGKLTKEEREVSGMMSQMWTNFAFHGSPGFNLEPWSQADPWYVRITANTSIEVDYTTQYTVANQEAQTTTDVAPTTSTEMPICRDNAVDLKTANLIIISLLLISLYL